LQIGLVRAAGAAVVGYAAFFVAGRAFIRSDDESLVLATLQIGLALLGAMAFLLVAEAAVPSGSGLRVVTWRRASRNKLGRIRRYAEILAIVLRHGLLSARWRRRASNDVAERRALARSLCLALQEGGVTLIKLGQLLSARRDLLPAEFTDELATLTDAAPPAAWADIERTLQEDLASADIFDHVDRLPMAAASIDQIHAATLCSGEAVVVKVQRPGISPLIERDDRPCHGNSEQVDPQPRGCRAGERVRNRHR